MSDYLQWRSDRRICPHCGVKLEISNPIACFGLCGLIFGVLIGSSHYWGFGNEWLRLVTAVLISWMVLPIIIRKIGRSQVLSSKQKSPTKTQKWSRFVPASLLALAFAFTITYCFVHIIFLILYK
ncbi:MAG: hypothetical protein A2173_07450 [Planctomycetes bacterium RBG_13_44_8b]|nr:MAG: hypothetical protein A2173_07450 [Planctomycetes bacterium RBG_13_44_8b]